MYKDHISPVSARSDVWGNPSNFKMSAYYIFLPENINKLVPSEDEKWVDITCSDFENAHIASAKVYLKKNDSSILDEFFRNPRDSDSGSFVGYQSYLYTLLGLPTPPGVVALAPTASDASVSGEPASDGPNLQSQ